MELRGMNLLIIFAALVVSANAFIPGVKIMRRLPVTRIRPSLAKTAGGDGTGGGGGNQFEVKKGKGVQTIVIDKVQEKLKEEVKEQPDEDKWWRVLLHNDEVHSFEYVVEAIIKIVPSVSRKKAFLIARSVHQNGVGTITTVWKELAEQVCTMPTI
jgi:ATP-dependent Clp protease adapter protein ClpS